MDWSMFHRLKMEDWVGECCAATLAVKPPCDACRQRLRDCMATIGSEERERARIEFSNLTCSHGARIGDQCESCDTEPEPVAPNEADPMVVWLPMR